MATLSSTLFTVIPGFEPMDPFLMVGFHSDVFPARNSLDQTPGFPQHPHYGFETVTVMGRGNTVTDHADSMGGSGRYGDGDVQWMCAGRGISHSEMIGLRNADTQNVGEVFQLWLNLPAKSKKCEPHTTMMWAEDIPEVQGEGGATVRHIAGPDALRPPPNSWAADAPNNVRIQRITLEPGATYTLERTAATTALNLYPFRFAESAQLRVAAAAAGDAVCSSGTGAIKQTLLSLTDSNVTVKVTDPVTLENIGSSGSVEILLLEANPIGEPVTQQGPFVAASKDEPPPRCSWHTSRASSWTSGRGAARAPATGPRSAFTPRQRRGRRKATRSSTSPARGRRVICRAWGSPSPMAWTLIRATCFEFGQQ